MAAVEQFAAFVEATERSLEQAIGALDQPILRDAASHLCLGGGKRVRPRMVWAFAHCLPEPPPTEALIDVSVAAELIHSGSLLHDDVVDEGTTRRGSPTVNVKWSNTVAVLAGDLLLTQALAQVSGHPTPITTDAVAAIAAMTRAAMAEVEARGQLDLPQSAWRDIAEGKTGSLFAYCGRAVGHLTGDDQTIGCFDRCGMRIGVAFQLADDLIDLVGQQTGKDRYSDLRNREASYPILSAAAASPAMYEAVAELWRQQCPEEEVSRLGDRIAASDTIPQCLDALDAEIAAALDTLDGHRDSPGGRLIQQWAQQQLRARLGR